MALDIIFSLLMIFAIIKGFRKGLIVALFSLAAYFIGLAAAVKLSAVAAGYIGKTVQVSQQWLPVISFIAVFILVIFLVHLGAKAIEKSFQLMLLGWLNRIGGIVFYVVIYTFIFSILLFYAEQTKILQPDTIRHSLVYDSIQPWGPKAIDAFGKLLPFFNDMFTGLKEFFGHFSTEPR